MDEQTTHDPMYGVAKSLIDGMLEIAAAFRMGELAEVDDAIVDRAREIVAERDAAIQQRDEAIRERDQLRTEKELCICGHERDSHNDITKRCCHRVIIGIVDGDDPAYRNCNLCPPSGFIVGGINTGAWPGPLPDMDHAEWFQEYATLAGGIRHQRERAERYAQALREIEILAQRALAAGYLHADVWQPVADIAHEALEKE